jgi:hypothetical protein
MASMKQHLADMHKKMAAHHVAMSTHSDALAKCMGKAAEASDATKILNAMTSEHQQMAAYHADSADACEKAASADLNKMVPLSVSGIAPERPVIRSIPRTGAPSLSTIAQVNPAFAKLLEVDEEDDWRQG